MQVFTQMRTAVQSFFQAQPAASAEPSDEELARLWRQVSGRETLRPDSVAMTFARALLSRYGRPAGECFYVDAGHLREVRNGNDMPVSMSTTSHHGMVPLYTAAVAAGDAQPVADHKFYPHPGYRAFCQKCGKAEADHPTAPVPAQKADDAKLPAKIPEYEAVGGEYPSNDSYQEGYAEGWNAAIDAAMQRESGGGV
ncbi:hypothetical protein CAL18_12610 [Bordetella genomosp. 7]|nr:hypothetical protein CAL18_12610 [Bordetella genomosp. 7]